MNGKFAGSLIQNKEGYVFTYDPEYIRSKFARPISLTLPIRKKPYRSQQLFPFFDGLIPEGWLRKIAARHWKLKKTDRMGLLLTCCGDVVGSVSVHSFNADVK